MKNNRLIYCLISCLISLDALSKVELPSFISSNMVLQQQSTIKFFGKSSSKSNVKITVPWLEKKITVKSDLDGRWNTEIKTPKAGGPYNIIFDDGDIVELDNVYIGEVWLCSGQSNMEMTVKGFYAQPVINSNQTIADANKSIPIRMFTVKKSAKKLLQENVSGNWEENTSEAVSNFSATAYYFGKQLYESLRVPIGLINTSWGGSIIEAWMSEESLKKYLEVSLTHLKDDKSVKYPHTVASMIYNAMMYPLKDIKIKGVIWYQGESNRFNYKLYERLLPNFVDDLRTLFKNENMPFYYVQIAPFAYNDKSKEHLGALQREVQFNCEKKIPNSGMVVLMDIGDKGCIHPAEKSLVGKRLAYWALSETYGAKGIFYKSPRYSSKEIKDNKVILSFDYADRGLTSFGEDLKCFEIAGSDSCFHKAKAVIRGNKVEVWSESVDKPVAVRYGFYNYVKGDLFSVGGIPVSSFRTDY